MVKNKVAIQSTNISDAIVFGIQEKKGNDIVRLDLKKVHSSVADYFIVCNADSTTQVKAIADSVEEEVYKSLREDPIRKEGFQNAEWVILDYGDVVVHIFKTDRRGHYGIEDLWGDAEVKSYKSA
jgi:ribosome-associated protein